MIASAMGNHPPAQTIDAHQWHICIAPCTCMDSICLPKNMGAVSCIRHSGPCLSSTAQQIASYSFIPSFGTRLPIRRLGLADLQPALSWNFLHQHVNESPANCRSSLT